MAAGKYHRRVQGVGRDVRVVSHDILDPVAIIDPSKDGIDTDPSASNNRRSAKDTFVTDNVGVARRAVTIGARHGVAYQTAEIHLDRRLKLEPRGRYARGLQIRQSGRKSVLAGQIKSRAQLANDGCVGDGMIGKNAAT